jgi:hypothetical protein
MGGRPELALQAWERLAGQLLEQAERRIALVVRTSPLNFRAEKERLLEGLKRGQAMVPTFVYAPLPELSSLRRALTELCGMRQGCWQALYAERACELRLELDLVERIGTREFVELAERRYGQVHEALAQAARALALSWLAEPEGDRVVGERHPSDDWGNPESLCRRMQAELERHGLPHRIVVKSELASLAAVGDEVVAIRGGVTLTARQVTRLALHEVAGHALRRRRARLGPRPLFWVGTASCDDDEEGRALWLEEQAGLLESERRRALALRHLLALQAHEGASLLDAVAFAREQGQTREEAVELAFRVFRGGGLGRERSYLPSYLRVSRALELRPALGPWLAEGRFSVQGAEQVAVLCRSEEAGEQLRG